MRYDSCKERNDILLTMGYQTYKDYLESELWSSIKELVYGWKGKKCVACTKPSYCLHHKSYSRDVLLGNDLTGLVPLCYSCHDTIEFTAEKVKRGLREANRALEKLINTRQWQEKEAIRIRSLGKCTVCGNTAKKNSTLCKNHTAKINKLPRPKLPREGVLGCPICGMRRRKGRKYCPRCWDKENNCVREKI